MSRDTSYSDKTHAEAQLKSATEAANVALWSICPDTGETWFSDIWYSILGFEPNAFEPSFERFMEMMHPDDRAPTQEAFLDLIEGRTAKYAADFRLRTKDGGWRWIGATGAKVLRANNLPFFVYGMQMDITDRKTSEHRLAQTAISAEAHRKRLEKLAENSPAALFEFKIDTAGTVTLPYITAGVHEILGVPPHEVAEDGLTVFRNIFDEDREKMGPVIEESRQNLSPFRLRYRVKRPNTEDGFIWVQANSMPHREEDGSTVWFGSVYDISPEVKREAMLAEARDAMQHLALHDGLTGLPNRRHFDNKLSVRTETELETEPAAVLIRIDLDRFKYINDTLGHAAGDAVLVHVAKILTSVIAADDLASRVGGDEFCILLASKKTVEDAKLIVARILQELSEPFYYEGRICRFGASFGVASSEHGDIESGDLMSFADAALYEAKAAGRGRFEIFSKGLHDSILESRRLASEIENALECREFVPFFQPQICAVTGRLLGTEVLARWRKQDGQIISPDRFLPVAEQIRAVPLIDKLMVDRTVETLDYWRETGLSIPKLSFNVSSARLREHSMVADVRPIQDRGVQVAFELLESILLEEEDSVMRFTLDLASEAGIHIEVDDFGTGHASILGLLKVNPHVLKIDRRLTANVVETKQARDLVSSILGIARSLGIGTIAEGIETLEQAEILKSLGCFVFQGHFYAAPMDAETFVSWSTSNSAIRFNDRSAG